MSLQKTPVGSWLRRPVTIVLAAFLLRLLFLFAAHTYNFARADDVSYQNESTNISASLVAGHGFSSPFGGETGPSAWIAPIYPLLCAALFRIFGVFTWQSAIAILVFNAFFSAATCIPIFEIGHKLSGKMLGQASAWIWAVTPFFMKWPLTWAWDIALAALCATYLVEQTLSFRQKLLLPQTVSAQEIRNGPEWVRFPDRMAWVRLGMLFGLSLLVNPALATILLFSLFWLKRGSAHWKHLGIVTLVTLCVISPWLIRNRAVFGKWVFLRSNFAFELDVGNFHLSPGSCWVGRHPSGNPAEYASYKQLGEIAYIQKHAVRFRQFLHEHPKEFVVLTGKRFVLFWDGTTFRTPWAGFWMPWLYLPLSLGAGLGILFMWRDKIPDATMLFFIMILYPWAYYISCIQTRFRPPIEPLLLIASVYAGVAVFRILKNRLATLNHQSQ